MNMTSLIKSMLRNFDLTGSVNAGTNTYVWHTIIRDQKRMRERLKVKSEQISEGQCGMNEHTHEVGYRVIEVDARLNRDVHARL